MRKSVILNKRLSGSGVDGILVTDLANIRYLSGFTGSSGFIIITKRHSVFVTDFRYQQQAKDEIQDFRMEIENAERIDTIKILTQKYGIKQLGFEDHHISYGTYRKLQKKKISLKPLTDTIESIRVIKSGREISNIKTAVDRAEKAFRKLQPHIKTGVTERQLALRLECLLKKEGCKKLPFEVIVASGQMSALPHAKPTNKRIKKGDLVLFDWGGEYNGYYSDITRVIAVKGRHLTRQREIYSNVYKAQENAIKAVRPGAKAKDIDSASREHIEKKGYGEYFGHSTGHGIGLAVHEKPVISWQNKDKLQKGMVFTVEPGIYLPGFGGVRIEDMIHVTGNGSEVLTTLPRKLKII